MPAVLGEQRLDAFLKRNGYPARKPARELLTQPEAGADGRAGEARDRRPAGRSCWRSVTALELDCAGQRLRRLKRERARWRPPRSGFVMRQLSVDSYC